MNTNARIIPAALAIIISGLFAAALPAQAQPASASASAASASAQKATTRHYYLKSAIASGKMVFLDDKGVANPVLKANVGDTVEVHLSSGEGAEHDMAIPELNVASPKFDGQHSPQVFRFKASKPGKFTYFCTVPGHRQIGMEGTLEVTGTAPVASAKQQQLRVSTLADAKILTQSVGAARADAIDISMDPSAVPKPIGPRAPQLVKYKLTTEEVVGQLDDGTTFTYWTFNKTVPGPMLRVKVGDTVEVTLANSPSSKNVHSIDLHAATGGLGGGAHTQVAPGKEETMRFKALNPGLYVYHCATPSVAHHISEGMYGLILVEPEGGLPKVDREYYVMQGDIYTTNEFGTKGHQEFDARRMADEMPQYFVFNGAVGSLMKEKRLTAKVGETVRIYFGVGGPNKISSFHVIGEIFDKVYSEASLSTAAKHDVQTTLVPAGGATMVEFKLDYPGKYLLVDHALSRAAKGLAGVLEVTGPADDTVYKATGAEGHMAH